MKSEILQILKAVGNLCKKYDAIFHSDTVQTVGHFPIDLRNIPVILLPLPDINFMDQKVWAFYISMKI